MFQVFFWLFCSSLTYQCVADARVADPVPNMTLVHIQVATRHGSRSPLDNLANFSSFDKFICDNTDSIAPRMYAAPVEHYRRFRHVYDDRYVEFRSNCGIGELTVDGMKQHKHLGSVYREYLVEKLGFLPKEMDPKLFHFISSPIDRCIKSEESFLSGLYPIKSPDEVLMIETGIDTLSSVYPNPIFCGDIREMIKNFSLTQKYQQFFDENWESMKEVAEMLHIEKDYNKMNDICEWAATYYCGVDRLPSFMTDEFIDKCLRVIGFNHFDLFETNPGVAFSFSMRHMLTVADEAIGGKGVKYVHFSGHDSTLAAFMVLLGVHMDRVPPYASHIATEIWADNGGNHYIRFVYNGEPLVLKDFGQSLVRYDWFRSVIVPKIQHCFDVPV